MKLKYALFAMSLFVSTAVAASDLPQSKAELFGTTLAQAAAPGTPPAPPTVPVGTGGGTTTAPFCDVTVVSDGTVQVGVDKSTGQPILKDLGMSYGFAPGMPIADADDNDKRGLKIIKMLAEAQNKGGPYSIEVGTYRSCNGIVTRIAANSIVASGITLKDAVKIADEGIKLAQSINNERYKARANRGNKFGQDHAGAPDFTTDEFGRKVRKAKK